MNKRQRKKMWDGRGSGITRSLYEYPYATENFCRKMMKEFGGKKEQWALTLKVGDFVEDCRCKKVEIKEISFSPYHVDIVTTKGRCCNILACCDEVNEHSEPDTDIEE